jgi:Protein of unknown function (DUF3298)/Deacetylase PdaC
MKKLVVVLLGIVVSISLTACLHNQIVEPADTKKVTVEQTLDEKTLSAKVEAENNIERNTKEATNSNAYIDITYVDKSREIRDKNGNLLLTVTSNLPVVTIKDNSEATEKINEYFDERQKKQEETIKEYIEYATDNYTLLNTDQLKYWNGYGLGEIYTSERVDSSVISIVNNSYEYAGGAHPNTTRTAQNFDTQTGQFLTLADVLTDVNKGTEFINNYLLTKMKESEDTVGFFEDYESSVKDILTDHTWYLTDEGFVVISNVYIVSPYAAGIQEYVIPYSEFPYLVEKYQKK